MHGVDAEPLPVDLWVAALVIIICIAMSAFFSGSETALTAASHARMHALERSGDRRAALVNRLLGNRDRLIGAILLGNTIVSIGSSAFLTSVLEALVGYSGAIYATGLMTVLLLVFAEVLPKTVAINYPDRVALYVSRVISFFVAIFGPILTAVEFFVRSVLRSVGIDTRVRYPMLSGHEELRSAVDLLHRAGGVKRSERDMFGGLLELHELVVEDVMVHRTKMYTIDADLPANEFVRAVAAAPHTRLPIWRDEPDNIIGVLHVKDLLRGIDASGGDIAHLKVQDVVLEAW